ncbi:MAG: hypothetical protein WCJ35_01870 [Planctomycetota bacterium]
MPSYLLEGRIGFDLDDNQFTGDLAPYVMQVFGRDGWDDPAMDVYNELDPRNNP